jgi:RNA polymerase sigma-70 factor (ECF subfamily)
VLSIGVRTARRLLGAVADELGGDAPVELADALENPELAVLRERYRDQVRLAFATALRGLEPRQRTLLRQYHIDRLTIDQLASLHRVNRSTTARWVAAARSATLELTREHLSRSAGIAPGEVDSIIRLVRSQLDLSLRELD